MGRQFYTVADVASMLGVSSDQVRRFCRDGKMPHTRLGKRTINIPVQQFERWVAERSAAAAASNEGEVVASA